MWDPCDILLGMVITVIGICILFYTVNLIEITDLNKYIINCEAHHGTAIREINGQVTCKNHKGDII
jgi:hypothetical protein